MKNPDKPIQTELPVPSMDVDASLVRLASTCMARVDIRYYLNGIRVEPRAEGGVFIIGTDGHRILIAIDATGKVSAPLIFKLDKQLVPKLPKPSKLIQRKQRLLIEPFRGRPALVLTDKDTGKLPVHIAPDVLIEGNYPDWRKVVPDFTKVTMGVQMPFQARYLSEVLAVIAEDKFSRAVPYQADPNGGIVFSIDGMPHVLLVIMPQRSDKEAFPAALAENFTRKPEKAASKAKETAAV
jgi:hypothetical protein